MELKHKIPPKYNLKSFLTLFDLGEQQQQKNTLEVKDGVFLLNENE